MKGGHYQVDPLYKDKTIDAVRALKDEVIALCERRMLPDREAIGPWLEAVNTRLLPRLLPDYPLVTAICGGGSSGKSTLFNSLVGETASPTGGRAGINRRLLVSMRASYRHSAAITNALFDSFGTPPQEMTGLDQLTVPGPPLLHFSTALPTGLALVDTPDFDTGSGGDYLNREMAEQSLRIADVLIYIFTNANYNNRDNTDFIARLLTEVGTRNCLLVYRAYPGFTDKEILDHANTVARNLYGETAGQHVQGVFRADEDNRVAAGQRPVSVHPVQPGQPGLMETLAALDPRKIRGALHRSVFSDVIRRGETFFQAADDSKAHLALYVTMLRKVQQQCVQDALGHLPMDAVVRRFSEIWRETDPSHVKIMRTTGKVVETPVRLALRAAQWIGRRPIGATNAATGNGVAAVMEADLIRAANRLRQACVDPAIHLPLPDSDPAVGPLRDSIHRLTGKADVSDRRDDGETISFHVATHPSLEKVQEQLRSRNWSEIVDDLLNRQKTTLGLTSRLEEELQRLVREQRSRMTAMDQVRQTAAAMLNIIPATAAVTYVLSTGDPVGATGIKVQLAGLFGLNDLYALVAIPATAGMKKADLKQLEALLAPVAQAWLTHKLTAIQTLFEETITGPLFQEGEACMAESEKNISSMKEHLACCHRALETRP